MIFAYIGCLLLGFAAGLFSFKAKGRWCSVCGDRLQCLDCLRRSGALDARLKRP